MPRRLIAILPVLIVAVLGAFFWRGLQMNPQEIPSVLIDKPAPAFDLKPVLPGVPGLSTADLQGKVTLVNFFASWCVPCRAEHPLITELGERGVRVVGINYKDRPDAAQAWLGALGHHYAAIGADLDGRAGIDFGVYGVPETYLIDKAGRIRFKHTGQMTREAIARDILPRIAELSK